jgi:hypothetical protein
MLGLMTHAAAFRAKLTIARQEIHGVASPDLLVPELISTIVAAYLTP